MASDLRTLYDAARDLPRSPEADDPLLERLSAANTVLLGEASHGTHEFYDLRAEVTRRLIEDHGFHAVAIEGDWPDAWQVHQYVTGRSEASDAEAALSGFTRFPVWMWRNQVVAPFVEWLHERNAAVPAGRAPAAFVGLDLYSLHRSIREVLAFLDRTDPEAAARARLRYACFDHASIDGQSYGYGAATGRRESCEPQVLEQLGEVLSATYEGTVTEDELFDVARNAKLVVGAEEYHRTMFRGGVHSWNLRDRHMATTLESLRDHLDAQVEGPPRIVVWAHNSHLGDARATEMGRRGEFNLGQLVRERHPGDVVSVGMTTHRGEVTASHAWDGPHQRMRVREALPGSHEDLLHGVGPGRYWLDLTDPEVTDALTATRLERAIGVIYRPQTERVSHYFSARLAEQFDVVCHIDETTALEPLDAVSAWDEAAVPDTYPWAV